MTFKVPLPFTKYACCTCEWTLRGNSCKHQITIFLTCTNLIKKISFNIVGHGMDLIVEVLMPCLRTLPIYAFMTMNLMMKRLIKIIMKSHGLLICAGLWHWMIPPPMLEKKQNRNQPSSSSIPMEKTFVPMGDIM